MALRSCTTFVIRTDDPDGSFARARTAIEGGGGQIYGDGINGQFQGASPLGWIKGTYTRLEIGYGITITRKPVLVPCRVIEDRIREYFA